MAAAMTMTIEEAAPVRRSRSAGLRGRYGDSEEFVFDATRSCGFRVVERNTFLNIEFDVSDDESTFAENGSECRCEKDDCRSEVSSNVTTEPPSTPWSDYASEGSESDHEEEIQVVASCPPGHLAVSNVAVYYCMPVMMVAAPVMPAVSMVCTPAVQSEEVQKKKRFAASAWGAQQKKSNPKFQNCTTIMIKNVPAECTNSMMVEMLDSAGLSCKYDFVYAPTDFRNYTAFGYAFVNFSSPKNALLAMEVLDGFMCQTWSEQTTPFEVSWCELHQGLKVHIKRYQNSPVMHPDVLEPYKPLLFKNGVRQVFPAPTKRIKEPRLRRSNPTDTQ